MKSFCQTCLRPLSRCLCSFVRKVPNQTQVFILQHSKERLHPKGTAKLAQLCLNKCELLVDKSFSDTLQNIIQHYRAVLLWPSSEETSSDKDQPEWNTPGSASHLDKAPLNPVAIIAIDGTWKKAAKIFHTHPELQTLPRLSVTGQHNRYHHRKSPSDQHLSTLEAIFYALETMEGETHPENQLAALLDAQADMIAHWHSNLAENQGNL
jgi:DTW domain-containing protein YfiP